MAANWSLNEVLAQLDSGRRWASSTITYSFPGFAGGLFSQGEAAGFRAVEPAQQSLMVLALATWDELIPQGFAPGAAGSTNIEFGFTSTNIGYAHAYYPTNGSIYFNATEDTLVSTDVGQYGFQTYVHEIGHSLGLNHMGDYNGNGNWSPSSFQDSVVLSVMSYFGPRSAAPNYSAEVMQADWVGSDGRIHSPQTPMVNDVLAIQTMYGTSSTTRTGDTVYGFNTNVGGATARIYDFAANPYAVLTLFDSGGTDTLDLSGWSAPSRVDLTPGAYSSANEMTNNIAIAYSATIENAIGGGGNDVITGNAVANRLVGNGGSDALNGGDGDDLLDGGTGDDQIDGGPGNDTAVFAGAFGSYQISVSGSTVTLVSAASGRDRTVSVERFQFADAQRTLAELSGGVTTDTAAPVVRSLSPADNGTNAAVAGNLVVTFDEPVKVGNGTITIFNAEGTVFRTIAVNDSTQVSVNANAVTIDPSGTLPAGRGFYVNWSAGSFTDLTGNAHPGLSGNGTWNFSTASADTTAPVAVLQSPADDSANVPVGSNLVLTFSEPVVAGTGNILIRVDGTLLRNVLVTDSSQVTVRGSTLTIDPGIDLPAGSPVSVTVDAGAVRDAAGNAFGGLLTTTAWNFNTAAAIVDDLPDNADTTGRVVVGSGAAAGVIEVGGDRDRFRVDLIAGQSYAFTLERTAGGLSDPYLTLISPTGRLLAEDDDSAGAGNSRLGFTPDTSGSYYLSVRDYQAAGTGAYTLRATIADAQAPTIVSRSPADDATAVDVDADLTLTFSEVVTAGSGLIRVLDAGGALLREIRANDSGAVSFAGTTVTIDPGSNLPAGSAFSVVIDAGSFIDAAGNPFAGLAGAQAWNFSTVDVGAGDDFPLSVSTPGVVTVNGAPLQGSIDYVDDGDLFRVALTAGVTYRFDLTSPATSEVDPYLMLFGRLPEVELVGYDDDSGPLPLDSQLYFTPSASGEYYLAAYDYAEATGRYAVAAVSVADDFLGSTATTGRVTLATGAVSGQISAPSDVDMFAVTLSAGVQYTFELWSSGFNGLEDPYLALVDAGGNLLASDDDTGVDLESLITYTATASGTYYLAAMDYDTGVGGYQVSGFARNTLFGSSAADSMTGTSLRDTLDSGAGNDVLRGASGDDILQGGDGVDVGRYAGDWNDYFLEHMPDDGWVVRDLVGLEGRDLAYHVERLQFDDGFVAIDTEGRAGTTARFLGAVFGPESVLNEVYAGIGIGLLDAGMTEPALMQLALDARLGPGASAAQVVDLLYANLFGVLPPPAERQFYVDLIDSGAYTRVSLAQAAADTEWNLANIDDDFIQQNGLAYVPYLPG